MYICFIGVVELSGRRIKSVPDLILRPHHLFYHPNNQNSTSRILIISPHHQMVQVEIESSTDSIVCEKTKLNAQNELFITLQCF